MSGKHNGSGEETVSSQTLPTSVKFAKIGPHLLTILLFAVGFIVAVGAQLVGVPVDGETAVTLGFFGFGIGVTMLAVTLLYQAVFIYRNPALAIEHDIHPPSKYDTTFDSERGAKKTALLGFFAGAFGLMMGGGALLVAVNAGV